MTQSLSMTVAHYAASTSADAIPGDVAERAKQVVFDELASAYFGRGRPAGELAARYVATAGGAPESRVLGAGTRAPAPYAALANGAAGHADEIDGAHVVGGHPGAVIVHAAAAVAEKEHTSGAEFLNAVVLGYDVGARLVDACGGIFGVKNRFHTHSDFLHAVSAAVAVSRVLGLDPDRHAHAMALATFQANGLCALFDERRHISKSFCYGQYAFAGVSAAMMAVSGLEGSDDILGTRFGVLDAWGADGAAETLTEGLGSRFAIMSANFKFINAGYPIHAPVEAALRVKSDHGLEIMDIDAVEIGMPENSLHVVDNRQMHNICVQDMVTAALLRDGLDPRTAPFPEMLADPTFAPLRSRVSAGVDAELDHDQPDGRGARVSITTTGGATHSVRIDHPRGHCLRGPITWGDLAEKWHIALPGNDIERLIDLARTLDKLDDVAVLVDAFAG